MGVPLRKTRNRVTKRASAPRKTLAEAFQAKLVQSHIYSQFRCGQCANKPKSPHNAALQKALKCTECVNLHITPFMMEADISAGSYNISQYPPFFSCQSVQSDCISPSDKEPHQYNDATFWDNITFPQQQQYFDKVDALLKKIDLESSKPIDEATVLFAHYQVDFHIRQHYLNPRSFLNLCQTKEEIAELNTWEWKVAAENGTAVVEDPDWGVGWKHEPSNSVGHRIAAWQEGQRDRKEHLAEVRVQWDAIQEERKRQQMRTVRVVFKGVHVRTCMYEPVEPSLTEEEVVGIARHAAERSHLCLPE